MRLDSLIASPDSEGKRLTGKGDRVEFEAITVNYNPIVKLQYDKKLGRLTAIRKDGQTLVADGFLTQESLGRGRKGKRGLKGDKGRNGFDGIDGKQGDVGCKGKQGEKGNKGIAGLDAEDGPIGNPGRDGCPGIPGEEGDKGDKGDKGHQGEIGLKGISCIVGRIGPIGDTGNGDCVISRNPPAKAYIWGDISDYPSAVPPTLGSLDFTLNSLNQPLTTVGNNRFTALGVIGITDLQNASSQLDIKWSGDYESDSRVNATPSIDKFSLTLEAATTIDPSKSATLSGNVKALITDKETGQSHEVTTPYKFSGTNSLTPPEEIYGVISEDQTVVEGNSATFVLNITDKNGVVRAVESDIEIRFSFGGATNYISSSADVSRVIRAGESSTSITVQTLDVGSTQRSVTIQARGANTVTQDSLTATLIITEATQTQTRNLVYPSTVVLTEPGGGNTATYQLKLQVDTPFTGNETGEITVKLSSGTARVGTLANGSESTLVSVESLTRRVQFDKNTPTVNVPIRYIDDSFTNGSRTFNIEFSDAVNINLPATIVASLRDDESSGGGGGGGGCIARDSLIELSDGRTVRADLLTTGDLLAAQTGIDKIGEYESFNYEKSEVRIEQIQLDSYHKYLVIEGLSLTHDHPVFVLRENYSWLRADQIKKGDKIFKDKSWHTVNEIIERFEHIEVVNFNVEPNDVYYANGILVHNAELNELGQQKKV